MSKKRYRVDFFPLDKYFFSNEDRYRLKSTDGGLKLSMDYYQISRRLPQQTTILGALRYLKLISIGQIPIIDKTLVEQHIGTSSFRYKVNEKAKQDFGAIANLSPVCVGKGDETFFPNAFDLDEKGKRVKIRNTTFTKKQASLQSTDSASLNKGTYILQDYNEKDGIDHYLISDDGKILKYDDVFISSETVGIKKNNRTDQEDTLYKQTSYSLANGYSFRVEADLDIENVNDGYLISMGADGHLFRVTLKEIDAAPKPKSVDNYNYVCLTSDTLIHDFDIHTPLFSIVETDVFRHLRSKVKENNNAYYHSKPYRNDDKLMPENEFSRSQKYMLLKRGSVFWFEKHPEAKKFTELIDIEQNMVSIGYNHYITEKIKF